MTLSRSLTAVGCVSENRESRRDRQTVEAPYNGLLVVALLDDDLDVGVGAGKRLEVVEEKSAGVGRGGPAVAVLDDELADVGDKGCMAVCRERAQLCSEDGSHGGRDSRNFRKRLVV